MVQTSTNLENIKKYVEEGCKSFKQVDEVMLIEVALTLKKSVGRLFSLLTSLRPVWVMARYCTSTSWSPLATG